MFMQLRDMDTNFWGYISSAECSPLTRTVIFLWEGREKEDNVDEMVLSNQKKRINVRKYFPSNQLCS